jgi:hypothetical protein
MAAKKKSGSEFEGIATEGASELPHNHRLRAEALVARKATEDPDGLISPELIADTKDRLDREAKAAEKANAPEKKPAPKKGDKVETPAEPGADQTETEKEA